ncbi:hypothetical protein AB0I28_20980 [Phytomonospora sp. NPDC050363]|uniref:hypothetical protein n=1 Tax=Phytomonospora sp. NPDC050363 TaxID=3155642 RepID=UPI0033E08FBB
MNPAAPAEVLLRLLLPEAARGSWWWLFHRRAPLPEAVYDAMVAHPDTDVRVHLAEGWYVPAAQRARLVDDPSARVRAFLAAGPQPFREPVEDLPAAVYERLAADPVARVRSAVAGESPIGAGLRETLAADPVAEVRAAAISAWPDPPEAVVERLLADGDEGVRRAAMPKACGRNPDFSDLLLEGPMLVRAKAIDDGMLHPATAELLAADDGEWTRAAVAANPSLPEHLVERLAADPSRHVRLAVSMRPELSESRRMAVDVRVRPFDRLHSPGWVVRGFADPELMRACAASAHIGLRRAAACSPHLPSDVAAALAADADPVVRLLLCENHPDVPGELLLSTFLEARVVTRGALLRKASFPRAGLAARFGGSPDPEEAMLALLDPEVPDAVVDRLSRDEDAGVRGAAAAHAGLGVERALELLGDPDAEVATAAASNPGVPVAVMHRLLDEAGVPGMG